MFFRPAILQTSSAAAMVLVLLGSLPQVTCCCHISWGPAGLFGGLVTCQEVAAAPKSCCCCQATEGCEESTSSPTDADGKCRCTLSSVIPAPMNGAKALHVEGGSDLALAAPTLPAVTVGACGAASGSSAFHWRPPITPPARCALFQTWRI